MFYNFSLETFVALMYDSLSPHISYLPDRYIDEVEYSLRRRTHAIEGYILKRHKSHFQDEPLIFM